MKTLTVQQLVVVSVVLVSIIASLTALVITGHIDPATLKLVFAAVLGWLIPSPVTTPTPVALPNSDTTGVK